MTANSISAPQAGMDVSSEAATRGTRFRFDVATPEDNLELQRFSRAAEMPGVIRFSFDRTPDYLAALCVEGRYSEVLVCREGRSGRVVATGHRSVKPAFVNREVVPVGYLSGLRVEPGARNGQLLARGYRFLRNLHASRPARLYLTTIMEDNREAKDVLLSARCGLPAYHDFGRFCCVALGLRSKSDGYYSASLSVRSATAADGPAVVEFLNREGSSKQFFPEYRLQDFGRAGGLLSGLEWKDVFLGFRANELVGVLGAWDQRPFRRWQISGYAPWLRWSRLPLNLIAGVRGMPRLPKPGSSLDYFILSLACIREEDPMVFRTLLETILREKRSQYAFLLAGFHERDPLLPELLVRPHVPLHSRLYVVSWDQCATAAENLSRDQVPYLELGAL
jgi:hypothetical protein